MANTDIRVQLTIRNHPKLKRLRRLIGLGAMQYLVFLWAAAAESRTDGDLNGWDDEDLADICDFEGEPQKLVQALKTAKWLDESDGHYRLHDWEEWQPWVVGAPERSKQGKHAADVRWQKADRMQSACDEDAGSIESAMPPSLPNHTLPNQYQDSNLEVRSKVAAAALHNLAVEYLGRDLTPLEAKEVKGWTSLPFASEAFEEAGRCGGKSLKYVKKVAVRIGETRHQIAEDIAREFEDETD